MRDSAFVIVAVVMAGCVQTNNAARKNFDTIYLRGNASSRSEQAAASFASPGSGHARMTTPTPGRGIGVATLPPSSNAVVDDHLRARRAQLLKRVEDLSDEDADSVCLSMQLVPREQIFDRSVKPRKILVHYTSQAASEAELDFLERVLNDRR